MISVRFYQKKNFFIKIFVADKNSKLPDLLPVFMSVDPARDTPKAISEYLKDFHPTFVGLTGTEDQIKIATKSFRVYYSSGPKDDENDYIVSF